MARHAETADAVNTAEDSALTAEARGEDEVGDALEETAGAAEGKTSDHPAGWRRRVRRLVSPARLTLAVGLSMVIVFGGLAGALGYQLLQQHRAQDQRALFVQVAKQGAVNLTTIDWQHADADVARILDSATGEFYDDFSKRSKPFVDVVKQAKSKSVGTITDAGLESQDGDTAQVLVAVAVNTENSAAPQQEPRRWKMRLTVQKAGSDQAKVAKVVFVP